MNSFVVVLGVIDVQATKAPWHIPQTSTNHISTTPLAQDSARTAQLSAAAFGLKSACIAATYGTQNSYLLIEMSLKVWKTLHAQKQTQSEDVKSFSLSLSPSRVWMSSHRDTQLTV
eukprot:s1818_g7.t1